MMRAFQPSDVQGQCLIVSWSTFIHALIEKRGIAPIAQRCSVAPAGLLKTFEGPTSKRLLTYLKGGGTDDQRVVSFQDSLIPQIIQRGQELPPCEITGRTEDNKDVWLRLLF